MLQPKRGPVTKAKDIFTMFGEGINLDAVVYAPSVHAPKGCATFDGGWDDLVALYTQSKRLSPLLYAKYGKVQKGATKPKVTFTALTKSNKETWVYVDAFVWRLNLENFVFDMRATVPPHGLYAFNQCLDMLEFWEKAYG